MSCSSLLSLLLDCIFSMSNCRRLLLPLNSITAVPNAGGKKSRECSARRKRPALRGRGYYTRAHTHMHTNEDDGDGGRMCGDGCARSAAAVWSTMIGPTPCGDDRVPYPFNDVFIRRTVGGPLWIACARWTPRSVGCVAAGAPGPADWTVTQRPGRGVSTLTMPHHRVRRRRRCRHRRWCSSNSTRTRYTNCRWCCTDRARCTRGGGGGQRAVYNAIWLYGRDRFGRTARAPDACARVPPRVRAIKLPLRFLRDADRYNSRSVGRSRGHGEISRRTL